MLMRLLNNVNHPANTLARAYMPSHTISTTSGILYAKEYNRPYNMHNKNTTICTTKNLQSAQSGVCGLVLVEGDDGFVFQVLHQDAVAVKDEEESFCYRQFPLMVLYIL